MNIVFFTDDYMPSLDGAVTSIRTFRKEFLILFKIFREEFFC